MDDDEKVWGAGSMTSEVSLEQEACAKVGRGLGGVSASGMSYRHDFINQLHEASEVEKVVCAAALQEMVRGREL